MALKWKSKNFQKKLLKNLDNSKLLYTFALANELAPKRKAKPKRKKFEKSC